ncbi:MAG: hypothetical protein HYY20_11425 [Candidatus Tectomicrobia bacterium]|uniref:IclR-ED domain-containing protein n=1 Tax=Tectimicrobiota bacterium TaxID=2528274 RepID=A0A932FXE2_UNCTE|nr:hypothetical protein [Candidatus Tectomicrobia bacterium]
MEILSSKISVYEIELRLGSLEGRDSREFPDFIRALVETLPSLFKHKCVFGQEGGFVEELRRGTDFAHILEHVILELEHLADPDGVVYSGWTRQSRNTAGNKIPGLYAIHYETRDPLTGHLAAILALRMITSLLHRQKVDREVFLAKLRNPGAILRGFSPESVVMAAKGGLHGMLGVRDIGPGLIDLLKKSDPLLQMLRDRARGTVSLWISEERELIAIKVLESQDTLRVSWPVGKRAPLGSGSRGRVLMAYLSEREVDSLLSGRPGSASREAAREILELKRLLPEIRAQGFSLSNEEEMAGVQSISVPILSDRDEVVAALELSLPVVSFSPERLPELIKLVRGIGHAISCNLGYQPTEMEDLEFLGESFSRANRPSLVRSGDKPLVRSGIRS